MKCLFLGVSFSPSYFARSLSSHITHVNHHSPPNKKTAEAKTSLDAAKAELVKAQAVLRAEDGSVAKLNKDYEATQKALAQSQKNVQSAEKSYKQYLERSAKQAKKDAENKKKAEKKKAEQAKKLKKKQAEQAKKLKKKQYEAEQKLKKKQAEQAKKERQAEEKARKKRQEEQAKAAQKAKEQAAKVAKAKAEQIKKIQAGIEKLEKERRDLIMKDAPASKVTATELKIKESKSELMALLKSK